jgi:hypothetical protein
MVKKLVSSAPLMSGTKLFSLNGAIAKMHFYSSLTWIEKLSTKYTTNVYHAVHGVPLHSDHPANLCEGINV